MREHYEIIKKDTEKRVEIAMMNQLLDASHPNYGGFINDSGFVQVKITMYRVSTMTTVYCNKETKYYHDPEILRRILLGLNYVERFQHENGLFDYVTCNFYSAPDTAFCIKILLPQLHYLHDYKQTEEENRIYEQMYRILKKAAFGLLEGGFHTPNHRWAIASALYECGVFFDEEPLKKAADVYLIEGIDCNEDGEYSEKSAGNYNRVNNDAMISLSIYKNDPSYEENAIRNLKLMLYYQEPNDSVFTANSTRFDKDHLCYPEEYYMEYLYLGMKYKIPEFLQMANSIFRIIKEKQIPSPDCLIEFMLHKEYIDYEYDQEYETKPYWRMYKDSGILRAGRKEYTYTVLNGKSNFLYFQNQTIKMEMKLGGSYFEHRAFVSETMEEYGNHGCHLKQIMRGWYYLPFKEKPESSDWWKMDQTKREKKHGPDMQIDVFVVEKDGGIDVTIQTKGQPGAPWRVELAFSGITNFKGKQMYLPVTGSESLVIRDGMIEAGNQMDALVIGPCFGTHEFLEGKEDSEVKHAGCATIYMTDYTEFNHTIQIRDKKSLNRIDSKKCNTL